MNFVSANGKQVIGDEIENSMQFSGIYALVNNVNNKLYIGKSVNVYERALDHFNCLNNNKHTNSHLQYSFNRYDNQFVAILVEKCDVNILDDREIFYISYYETYNFSQPNHGYNMTFGGDGGHGFKHTEETKINMSKRMTGNKLSDDAKKKLSLAGKDRGAPVKAILRSKELRITPIVQISFEGEITFWESAAEAARQLNIDRSQIRDCCNKKPNALSYKKSYWFNKDEYDSGNYQIRSKKSKEKPIVQLTLNDEFISFWNSVLDASRQNKNLNSVAIANCCRKKSKTSGGYKWMYKEEYEQLQSANLVGCM